MTTAFILLDAFRWDYINKVDTPFLYQLATEGVYVRRIKPGSGFCERTEIFTGMRADNSLNFTAIGYKPEKSFYLKHKTILKILTLFDKPEISRRRFRWFLNHIFRRLGAKLLTYEIPFSLLPYFDLTEDKMDHRERGAFLHESIFDVMQESGKEVFYDSFTALGMPSNGNDDDRIRLLLRNASHAYDLYLLFIGESDSIGHSYGPSSEETKKMTSRIDKKVQRFINSFQSKNEDVSFVFLGDHGMLGVDTYLNVWDKVKRFTKRYGLREKKDYLIFLDSALARFWFFNEKARELFEDMLSAAPFDRFGRIIDEEMASKYHIPYGNKEYGDIIWWADPGVVIYPDFFHSTKPVKGMHGYNPDHPDSKGFCIIVDKEVQPEVIEDGELVDICPTICDLVGVPYPSGNQGCSFL